MLSSEMAPSRGRIIREWSFWSLLGLFIYRSAAFILKFIYKNTEYDVSPLSFLWNYALFKINALFYALGIAIYIYDCILL